MNHLNIILGLKEAYVDNITKKSPCGMTWQFGTHQVGIRYFPPDAYYGMGRYQINYYNGTRLMKRRKAVKETILIWHLNESLAKAAKSL